LKIKNRLTKLEAVKENPAKDNSKEAKHLFSEPEEEAIKDPLKIFYSIAPPGGNNVFLTSRFEKEFQKKETIYKIMVENDSKATYTLVDDPETRVHGFNMLDVYIRSAMDIDGPIKPADHIIRITPGILTKNNKGNWRINTKGKIHF